MGRQIECVSARHTNLVPNFARCDSPTGQSNESNDGLGRQRRRKREDLGGRKEAAVSLLRGFEKQSVNPFHCRPCRKTSAQVHCRQDEPCHWPGYSARQGRAGDPEYPRQESTNPRVHDRFASIGIPLCSKQPIRRGELGILFLVSQRRLTREKFQRSGARG